ncbi:MAG: tRNA threonylcarbamoyladenosine dehydratase [Polaromonas sp.]|nr:tRNA threonylcarbamoyladenosine dehydratase [Polaromonas sp.]
MAESFDSIADSTLTADLDRRFGGLVRLYGIAGASRIRQAHVVVVGLGGVGSWAAEALARSGVARLTLIDMDHVAESNINRQIHALDGTLGQAKVQAMRERIAQINPLCDVRCIEEFVDTGNWPAIALLESDDTTACVIDACDNVKAKTAMAAWAISANRLQRDRSKKKSSVSVHFITSGAAGGKRHAHKVDIDDLSLTTHDPLLAQVRYRLRKEHGATREGVMGLACVFSREAVAKPLAGSAAPGNDSAGDGSLNCHGYGSVVSVTSTFGICAAGWVLDKIAGSAF